MMTMKAVMTKNEIERVVKQQFLNLVIDGWDQDGNLVLGVDIALLRHEKYENEEFFIDKNKKFTLVNKNGWKINVEKK